MSRVKQAFKTKSALLAVGLLGFALVMIASALYRHEINSDEVAQQAILHDIASPGAHSVITGTDNFVIKFPLYIAMSYITNPGVAQVFIESIVLVIGLLALWWIWLRTIAKPNASLALSAIWILSIGVAWMPWVINPNTRNIEIGLGLMLVLGASKWVTQKKPTTKRQWLVIALIVLAASVLCFSDPYIFYIMILPLLVAATWWHRKNLSFTKIAPYYLAAAGVFFGYKLLSELQVHVGFRSIDAVSLSFISPRELPAKSIETCRAILALFNVQGTNATSFLNLLVVFAVLGGVYIYLVKQKETFVQTWAVISSAFTVGVFVLSSNTNFTTLRYLIILVVIAPLFLWTFIQTLRQRKDTSYYWGAVAIIVLAIVANMLQAGRSVQRANMQTPNAKDYAVIQTLKEQGISKAYIGYWGAITTYYLSNYSVNTLAYGCNGGVATLNGYLSDNSRYAKPGSPVAIIVDPRLDGMSTCTAAAVSKQFGEPASVFRKGPVSYLIYNKDIFSQ